MCVAVHPRRERRRLCGEGGNGAGRMVYSRICMYIYIIYIRADSDDDDDDEQPMGLVPAEIYAREIGRITKEPAAGHRPRAYLSFHVAVHNQN